MLNGAGLGSDAVSRLMFDYPALHDGPGGPIYGDAAPRVNNATTKEEARALLFDASDVCIAALLSDPSPFGARGCDACGKQHPREEYVRCLPKRRV